MAISPSLLTSAAHRARIAAAADWLERRVQRRAVLRRIQPREHIHNWVFTGKAAGRSVLRCDCGQELVFDEGVDQ